MGTPTPQKVTRLLSQISQGDKKATEELLPLVYNELRALARRRMAREKPGQTLQPTALVHEAYLRLLGDQSPQWEGRGHFFAAAAEAMRRILIEKARQKSRLKRGGDRQRTGLDEAKARSETDFEEILTIDELLQRLEAQDLEMARVVKLRYFAGLTVEETAEALGTSCRSVNRLWTAAKAWLHRGLTERGNAG